MPPAQIDMTAIREAIARRQGGGASPALSQVTAPGASLPTGGPNTPTNPPPATATPSGTTPSPMPSAKPNLKQVGNFDDETRSLAKTLISKLMNVL
ncbi:MAG TPA: hypothetical protein VJ327_01360 [Patescibacteria group bacterium]|nr:hypothetical protein [Patescibacteria group bacterium]